MRTRFFCFIFLICTNIYILRNSVLFKVLVERHVRRHKICCAWTPLLLFPNFFSNSAPQFSQVEPISTFAMNANLVRQLQDSVLAVWFDGKKDNQKKIRMK
jgi:hypothetical protein